MISLGWQNRDWALRLMIVSSSHMAIVFYVMIATWVGVKLFFTLKIMSRQKYSIHQIPHSEANPLGLNIYCVQCGKVLLPLPWLLSSTAPDVSLSANRQLVRLLQSTCSKYSHKIIMGDWNADILDSERSDSRLVRSLIDELFLKLIDTGPSHHRPTKTLGLISC